MSTKNRVQRALPHDTTYRIISTHYSSIEEDGSTACENCGALITNVATVENKAGRKFCVGMDCAATLSGISMLDHSMEKAAFDAAKAARAKVIKYIKEGFNNMSCSTSLNAKNYWQHAGSGGWYMDNPRGGHMFQTYPKHWWNDHVFPMIKDLMEEETQLLIRAKAKPKKVSPSLSARLQARMAIRNY